MTTFDDTFHSVLNGLREQAANGPIINMGELFALLMSVMQLAAVETQQPEKDVNSTFAQFLLYHMIITHQESEALEIIARIKQWVPDDRPSTMN